MQLLKSEGLIKGINNPGVRLDADKKLVGGLVRELVNQGFIKFTETPNGPELQHRVASLFITKHSQVEKILKLLDDGTTVIAGLNRDQEATEREQILMELFLKLAKAVNQDF